MRRTILGSTFAVVTLVGWLVAPALAQETKTARGNVTAMSGDSITVKAGASELKFTIDAKTRLTASGAGTAERKAEAAGKPGPRISDFVKVGDAVEVEYHETGGTLHAANVRRVASAGAGGGSTSESRAQSATQTAPSGASAITSSSPGTMPSASSAPIDHSRALRFAGS